MMAIRFPAILKDENGTQIEIGTGELASEENTIIFRGGFIPLFRIGTKVEIIRTAHGSEVESFPGEVFRSTRNLISVTAIESIKMKRLKEIFFSNTYFPIKPHFFKIGRVLKNKRIKTYDIEATVYFINENTVKFLSIDPLKPGQQLLLDLKDPTKPGDTLIEVLDVIDYDGVSNACIATILQDPSLF